MLTVIEEPLPRPVEQLPQDVLVRITQELNIVLTQFDELFTFQIVRIVNDLIDDEPFHFWEMVDELLEVRFADHAYCAVRHRLYRVGGAAVEYYARFAFD